MGGVGEEVPGEVEKVGGFLAGEAGGLELGGGEGEGEVGSGDAAWEEIAEAVEEECGDGAGELLGEDGVGEGHEVAGRGARVQGPTWAMRARGRVGRGGGGGRGTSRGRGDGVSAAWGDYSGVAGGGVGGTALGGTRTPPRFPNKTAEVSSITAQNGAPDHGLRALTALWPSLSVESRKVILAAAQAMARLNPRGKRGPRHEREDVDRSRRQWPVHLLFGQAQLWRTVQGR